jgi:hypothetical protein
MAQTHLRSERGLKPRKKVFSLKIKDKHSRGRRTTRWKQQITKGGERKMWKETLAEALTEQSTVQSQWGKPLPYEL